jgi:tRNA(fMet)-specific endonuclease VapC
LNYVLDTNAVSAAMKGDPNVLERMREAGRKKLAVPEPVYAEIAYGIERLPKSKKRSKLLVLYRAIYEELGSMPWTHEVTEHFASVKSTLEHKGKRIEDFDAAIAAHALAAGAILVTADVDHMERVPGLKVEDWAAALSSR